MGWVGVRWGVVGSGGVGVNPLISVITEGGVGWALVQMLISVKTGVVMCHNVVFLMLGTLNTLFFNCFQIITGGLHMFI